MGKRQGQDLGLVQVQVQDHGQDLFQDQDQGLSLDQVQIQDQGLDIFQDQVSDQGLNQVLLALLTSWSPPLGTRPRPPVVRGPVRQAVLHGAQLPSALPSIPEPGALLQPPQCTWGASRWAPEGGQSQAVCEPAELRLPGVPDLALLLHDL